MEKKEMLYIGNHTTSSVEEFLQLAETHGFGKIVAHAPYTMNCCAAKEDLRIFARNTMADDHYGR